MRPDRTALACILVLLLSPSVGVAQSRWDSIPEDPIDVIIAVDSSLSLLRSDPQGFGKGLARDMVSFLTPGDRIGVVGFGGWEETLAREKGAVIFPLSEIPVGKTAAGVFVERYREAVESGLGEFGRGTDFNVAFQEGVLPMIPRPGESEPRLVWIIVYTDGGMDVVEGRGRVRQKYLDALPADEVREREALNRVATAILRREVLPRLKDQDALVTVLYPGQVRPEQRTAPLPSHIPTQAGPRRARLLRIIREMASVASQGSEGPRLVSAAAPLLYPFELTQGVTSARIFVFGEAGDYGLDLTGPRETHLLSKGMAGIVEEGRLYRYLEVPTPVPGDYLLTVETPLEETLRFLVDVSLEHDVRLFLELPEGRETYYPGQTVSVRGGLLAGATGDPIVDPRIIGKLDAAVALLDPLGGRQGRPLEIGSGADARIDLRIPDDTPVGTYSVRVEGTLGALAVAPAEASFTVRRRIRVELEAPTTFPGRAVRILGHPLEGTPGQEEVVVVIANEDESVLREVALVPGEGALEGKITLDAAGTWSLRIQPVEGVDLTLGDPASIDVGDRFLRVLPFDRDSNEFPEEELYQIILEETEEGAFVGKVGVEAHLAPGEEGTLKAILFSAEGGEVAPVLLDGEDGVIISGDDPRTVLEVTTLVRPADRQIEFRYDLVGQKGHQTNMVHFFSKGPRSDTGLGRAILLGGLFLLLLGLIIIWWITLPRFHDQRLWHVGDLHTSEYLVRELHRNFLGNRAKGVPEAPESVEFVLKTSKQIRRGKCLLRPLTKTDRIYVNQFAIAGPLEVQDGTEIIVERDGFPNRYIYYAAAPPPEEMTAPETEAVPREEATRTDASEVEESEAPSETS